MNPRNNGNWADCQRLTHDIWTVGEMEEYANETLTLQHSMRKNCACDPCRMARRKGCPIPAKCRQAAKKILDSLHLKWRPRALTQEDLDHLQLSNKQIQENTHSQENGRDVVFDPSLNSTSKFTEEFRVFVDQQKTRHFPAMWELVAEPQDNVTVLIHALHADQGYKDARSAYTVWFGEDDPRNTTRRTQGTVMT